MDDLEPTQILVSPTEAAEFLTGTGPDESSTAGSNVLAPMPSVPSEETGDRGATDTSGVDMAGFERENIWTPRVQKSVPSSPHHELSDLSTDAITTEISDSHEPQTEEKAPSIDTFMGQLESRMAKRRRVSWVVQSEDETEEDPLFEKPTRSHRGEGSKRPRQSIGVTLGAPTPAPVAAPTRRPSVPLRMIGTDVSLRDLHYLSFSLRNEFTIGEIVAVPRRTGTLNYGRVIEMRDSATTTSPIAGCKVSNVLLSESAGLEKLLPTLLVGKLPSEELSVKQRVANLMQSIEEMHRALCHGKSRDRDNPITMSQKFDKRAERAEKPLPPLTWAVADQLEWLIVWHARQMSQIVDSLSEAQTSMLVPLLFPLGRESGTNLPSADTRDSTKEIPSISRRQNWSVCALQHITIPRDVSGAVKAPPEVKSLREPSPVPETLVTAVHEIESQRQDNEEGDDQLATQVLMVPIRTEPVDDEDDEGEEGRKRPPPQEEEMETSGDAPPSPDETDEGYRSPAPPAATTADIEPTQLDEHREPRRASASDQELNPPGGKRPSEGLSFPKLGSSSHPFSPMEFHSPMGYPPISRLFQPVSAPARCPNCSDTHETVRLMLRTLESVTNALPRSNGGGETRVPPRSRHS